MFHTLIFHEIHVCYYCIVPVNCSPPVINHQLAYMRWGWVPHTDLEVKKQVLALQTSHSPHPISNIIEPLTFACLVTECHLYGEEPVYKVGLIAPVIHIQDVQSLGRLLHTVGVIHIHSHTRRLVKHLKHKPTSNYSTDLREMRVKFTPFKDILGVILLKKHTNTAKCTTYFVKS